MTKKGIVPKESTSLISRSVLVVFCLAAGFAYRASVSLIPTGIFEDVFLIGLAALLLTVAILTRRSRSLQRYWEIPFAFFVFTVAGFAGDVSISPLQQWFIHDVLHETPSVNNPLASTVLGTVLAQVFGTLSLVLPIILLTKASGSSLNALFLNKQRSWVWLLVSIIGFLVFFLLSASGRSQALIFPFIWCTCRMFPDDATLGSGRHEWKRFLFFISEVAEKNRNMALLSAILALG